MMVCEGNIKGHAGADDVFQTTQMLQQPEHRGLELNSGIKSGCTTKKEAVFNFYSVEKTNKSDKKVVFVLCAKKGYVLTKGTYCG